MTHNELLAKIALHWIYADDPEFYGLSGYRKALRAIVELHKPVQSYMFEEEACSHCSSEEDRLEILYPCPTIQKIMDELK